MQADGVHLSPTIAAAAAEGSLANMITRTLFEEAFKHRNSDACNNIHPTQPNFYTYENFIKAADAFPAFGRSSNDPVVNKREVAAFFAHIAQETTGGWATAPDGRYAWGLCFISEQGPPTDPYCDPNIFPCAAGKKYYGRGGIQLSWNYNYIPAGDALGFDGLNNPEIVGIDPLLAFKTAVWFWMRAIENKPSCHDVMAGRWTPTAADISGNRLPGFGVTLNVVNGGIECGKGRIEEKQEHRIGHYRRFAELLGVSVGDNLSCETQRPFHLG
jgi:chitinase